MTLPPIATLRNDGRYFRLFVWACKAHLAMKATPRRLPPPISIGEWGGKHILSVWGGFPITEMNNYDVLSLKEDQPPITTVPDAEDFSNVMSILEKLRLSEELGEEFSKHILKDSEMLAFLESLEDHIFWHTMLGNNNKCFSSLSYHTYSM